MNRGSEHGVPRQRPPKANPLTPGRQAAGATSEDLAVFCTWCDV
jgi:hypothetical protein